MTNLILYYPKFNFDYVLSSSASTLGNTEWGGAQVGESFRVETNLNKGIHQYYHSSVADDLYQFDFQLTASSTLNPTKLILHGLYWSVADDSADISVTFKGSNLSDFSTGENETYTIGLDDLKGHFPETFIGDVSFSTAYTYYRVEFNFTDSIKLKLKKIYFSDGLDLGIDPNVPLRLRQPRRDFAFMNSLVFDLKYTGLTNSQKQEIENNILYKADSQGIFLHDSGDLLFQGREILFCLVNNWKINRMMRDNWEIVLTLEAVI